MGIKHNSLALKQRLIMGVVVGVFCLSGFGTVTGVSAASNTAKCDDGKKYKVTADLAKPASTLDDEDRKEMCKSKGSQFTPKAECEDKFHESSDISAYDKSNCGNTGACRKEVNPKDTSQPILDCKNSIGETADSRTEKFCKPTSFSGFGADAQGCVTFASMVTSLLNLVAGFVGIAVVGGIVYGGFLYSQANGNSGKTQEAISIITNAVIGLLLFAFMYAIIQFLIPGGIL